MTAYIKNKGFTLVELAISLVVIGLLIGLGMSLVGPLSVAVKVRETKETIDGTVESINSWAAGNNSLPSSTNLSSTVKSPNDSWGSKFVYLYDNNLVGTSKDTICGRRTAALSIINNGVSPAITISDVAYLVLSRGDDASIQTTFTGTIATPPVTFTSGTTIPNDTISAATGTAATDTHTSDIVRWVTLNELRTKVGCQGAQLRIVNNELPFGNKGAAYPTIPLIPDGGVPFFPATTGIYEWCWSSATTQVLSDLVFACNSPSSSSTIARTAAPATCSPTSGTWQRCTSLNLSATLLGGVNPVPGSYDISLFLRDAGGSFTQKTFVITINPQ